MAPSNDRAGLAPLAGAVFLTLIAVGGSVGFLMFQGKEQERFLAARTVRCAHGATDACDVLRGLCIKRDPDACVALADAHLTAGASRDAREGVRLLGEACRYRHPRACRRAGTLALEGVETPRDVPQAKKYLTLGCDIGEREACGLLKTLP